jgi:kynureninase
MSSPDSTTDEAALLAYRAEFPTLANGVHLISHSLGAMPRRARALTNQFLDEWERDSIEAWHHWLPRVVETGDAIGKILGVAPGTVTIQQNVSTVQAIVASCVTFTPARNKVVYSSLNFHTVNYVWMEAERRGAQVVVVPSRDGVHAPMEELLAAIDERTVIVPVSHVLFRSSAIKDVRALVERTRQVGALLLLDCYQSAGTVPLALDAWGVDMACGGSVKWACGGPGCAYLYTRPEVAARLEPANTGWFGHKRPFAFEMGRVDYAEEPAWRMANGTPPVPALFSARAGWDLLAELGVSRIRAKSLRQTALLRTLVEARGFKVNTPRADALRGGTICFDFEGAEAVAIELNRRRFFCDYRPLAGVRASPHYYTTDEDLERFVAEIDAIRSGRTAAGGRAAY